MRSLHYSIQPFKVTYKKRLAENKQDFEMGIITSMERFNKDQFAKQLYESSLRMMGVCPIRMKTNF